MGEIKSALELALEKTAEIKSDPEAVRAHEAQVRGKRLFASLRENPDLDVKKALKAEKKDERQWVRQGFFDVILANLTLPAGEQDLRTLDPIERGLLAVINDSHGVKTLMEQIRQFFRRYLDDRQQLMEGLRKQYEPRLREKERQLAQQYGRPVRLDPSSDPEFGKALQEHLGQLQGSYKNAYEQVFAHLKTMFEKSR